MTLASVVRRASPRLVLASAWLVLVLYAYPGQMTGDSLDHLDEARKGIYTDGHPPAMAALWSVVDRVIAGPFGMLVIQSVALLAGLFLVLRHTFAPRPAAWAASALFLFPPVMLPMAVIWKDSLMAGLLMLALAGLLSPRRAARLAALAALFAATAIRYNALAASLPLVVLLFEWRPGLHWLRRYALATAAWLAITLAAFGVNHALTDHKMHLWHSTLAVFDIVGTLEFVDEELSDAELQDVLAGTGLLVERDIHATARRVYKPRNFRTIISDGPDKMWNLPVSGTVPAPAEQRAAIGRAWWHVVSTYPGAYLAHRFTVMAEVISLTRSRPSGVVTPRASVDPPYARSLDIPAGSSRVQHAMTGVMTFLTKWLPVFVPWLYVVIAGVLLPLTRRHRDVFAILASGLTMEGALIVLAPSADFRYSHWLIICTCLALVVLVARRARDAVTR